MRVIIYLVVVSTVAAWGSLPAQLADHNAPQSAVKLQDISTAVNRRVKTWGGTGAQTYANNTVVDGQGSIYVTGQFTGTVDFNPSGGASQPSNGAEDVFLSKFSLNGTFQWVKTWGGSGRDVANGIALDSLGNVYVTGPFTNTINFNPAGGASHSSNAGAMNNIFLSKFAPDGAFQWVKTWGPSDGGAESYSITVDSSDYVYVVGDFTGTTCDFNPWGAHDIHTNHAPDPASPYGQLFDAYLSKFDSSGGFVWAKTWGGEGYDDGPGVAVDPSGNVYVGGMYASQTINFDPAGGSEGLGHPAHESGISVDVFLSKFDASGNFHWVRTWGGQSADDAAEAVAVDRSGNVYVGGRFGCVNCDFNPLGPPDLHSSQGDLDAFVSKYDASGNFQWAKTWGGAGPDAAGGLVTDNWNNIYATGVFSNTVDFGTGSGVLSHGLYDIFLIKLASTGAFQWVKPWGSTGSDGGSRVTRDAVGNVYVAGWFQFQVDFDTSGSGFDYYTSHGAPDAFLLINSSIKNKAFMPLITQP